MLENRITSKCFSVLERTKYSMSYATWVFPLAIILLFSVSITPFTFAQNTALILSPLKQLKNGVSSYDVKCNAGLTLIIKTSDNSPACVKPQAATKLVERGWGISKEQMIWFEFVPLQCERTPWDKFSMNSSRVMSEGGWIKTYFKEEQGVTIIEAKYTPAMGVLSEPRKTPCGEPINYYAVYLLVSESDVDKMTKLGFKKLITPLPTGAIPLP